MRDAPLETLPLVSTVIPTFQRRELVCHAIESALAQTYPKQEIIVVDDGSTDGTREAVQARYGDRVRYVAQANAGVSSARNHGLRISRGPLIALLDSDDEWHPAKLAKQVAFLEAKPDIAMVLTDVQRVDRLRRPIDVFHRRSVIRSDGDVLEDVLQNPALAPASAMFRREVFERAGGFDESLRTAEDIEFHLRVAAAFRIGVIEEALTIARRGAEGLSQVASSDRDYVGVIERFIARNSSRIAPPVRRAALYRTYERNARSAFVSGRFARGTVYGLKGLARSRSAADVLRLADCLVLGGRALAAHAVRGLGMRKGRQS